MGQFLRSRPADNGKPPGPPRLVQGDFGERWPAVWEYLSQTHWEDGTERQPSSLTLFMGQGGMQAALNDKDLGRVCFVTAEGVDAVLDALEAGLEGNSLDWRRSQEKYPRKKKD